MYKQIVNSTLQNFTQQQGLVSLLICMCKLGFPLVIFSKFSSPSSQNICLSARSKVEGQNHLLYHKNPNSCICQERRTAFVSQAEVSFSPVQSNEQLLLWSLSKNISLHSAHSLFYACCSHYCALFPSVEFSLGHL